MERPFSAHPFFLYDNALEISPPWELLHLPSRYPRGYLRVTAGFLLGRKKLSKISPSAACPSEQKIYSIHLLFLRKAQTVRAFMVIPARGSY